MSSIADEDLLVGEPVVVGRRVIRPLATRSITSHREDRGLAALARLEPVGVLVEGPEGVHTLGLDGEELPDEPA